MIATLKQLNVKDFPTYAEFIKTWEIVPVIPGYTEATDNPHWACGEPNPNCPTGEHAQTHTEPRTFGTYLADRATQFGAVLCVLGGLYLTVAPIFV